MSIRSVRFIEPTVEGLNYQVIVETAGGLEPVDETCFTEDRVKYSMTYKDAEGADPRIDTWDTGITYTGNKARDIEYFVFDTKGTDLYPHREKPPVKDGI